MRRCLVLPALAVALVAACFTAPATAQENITASTLALPALQEPIVASPSSQAPAMPTVVDPADQRTAPVAEARNRAHGGMG